MDEPRHRHRKRGSGMACKPDNSSLAIDLHRCLSAKYYERFCLKITRAYCEGILKQQVLAATAGIFSFLKFVLIISCENCDESGKPIRVTLSYLIPLLLDKFHTLLFSFWKLLLCGSCHW